MKHRSMWTTPLAALMAVSVILPSAPARAGNLSPRLAELQGDWVATLSGNTGCGISSMLVTFHLDAHGSGAGTATIKGHSTGCKDSRTSGLDFSIQHMGPDGKGFAGLSCGDGCGWGLDFQVNRSNDIMTLTDVSKGNPNNTPTGVAIKQ